MFSSALDATEEADDIDTSDAMGDEGIGGEADAAGTRDQADIESAAVEDRDADSTSKSTRPRLSCPARWG